jgi:hypothetical protein
MIYVTSKLVNHQFTCLLVTFLQLVNRRFTNLRPYFFSFLR